jgi:hypothetical protein
MPLMNGSKFLLLPRNLFSGLVFIAVFLFFKGHVFGSKFTTLAVKGNVTYTADAIRKELKPGILLYAGNIIHSGDNGQAIIQLGSSFQIFQITSRTKARLTAAGIEKL